MFTPLQSQGGPPDGLPGIAQKAADGGVKGLEVAAQMAGDILRSIFGCLPWQSGCVVGQSPDAAAMITDGITTAVMLPW